MRALVIGASGFIGLNVVDELLAKGVDVRVTKRRQTVTFLLRKRKVEQVEASLDDEGPLTAAMRGCDVVLLTGGHYPRYSLDREASLRTGVGQVRTACRAALAAGVKRLVYTSTIATLARAPGGRAGDERDVLPEAPGDSVYRAVKWSMEREVEAWMAEGLNAATLLPGGCLGPWDLRVGTGGILLQAWRGELPWWIDGDVNIVDVGDVAAAHVQAALGAGTGRYCLSGHDIRVGELLRLAVARFGGRFPPECLGPAEARARADADEAHAAPKRERVPVPRELVDMAICGQKVSSARAERELGFHPRPLEETLDRAHDFYARCRFLRRSECTTKTSDAPA